MTRIISICFLLLFTLNSIHSLSFLDLYRERDDGVSKSFNSFWKGNFGDGLDISMSNDSLLTDDISKWLISKFTEANDELLEEMEPYTARREQLDTQLSVLRSDLNDMERILPVLYDERSRLLFSKNSSNGSSEINSLIFANRKSIYDTENAIAFNRQLINELKSDLRVLERTERRFKQLLRRNNYRIRFLQRKITPELPEAVVVTPSVPEEPEMVLIEPNTLTRYSLAAMEGLSLDRCPKEGAVLEYKDRMILDQYRGVDYSYPRAAFWCPVCDTGYITRDVDSNSLILYSEIKYRKRQMIDDMLDKK